jgi:electron transport complex protein RnfD
MSTRTAAPNLLLTTSPFLKDTADTAWIMWQVNFTLIPVVLAAGYFFGIGALMVVATATAGALLTEGLANRARPRSTVYDGSAVLTGMLLGLTLPPTLPLWMAFVGGVVALGLGKLLFGGIGANVFNPALVGRAFLQAAFPAAMTTWMLQSHPFLAPFDGLFTVPFMKPEVDAISAATPLSQMKFDGVIASVPDLLLGTIPGSAGETSALLILLMGAYLAVRRIINWRIPVSIFATVFVLAGLLHWTNPEAYPPPLFHLFAGGLMLGAVYMATDPVTSPLTQRGVWIYGVGIGILVVVIRQFGGLPEGVMYAILLMNAATPLINRATQPRTFGTPRPDRWKKD